MLSQPPHQQGYLYTLLLPLAPSRVLSKHAITALPDNTEG